VQDVNEERVVLEEVIDLETAAVTDPEISKKFAVVGCGSHAVYVFVNIYMRGQSSRE